MHTAYKRINILSALSVCGASFQYCCVLYLIQKNDKYFFVGIEWMGDMVAENIEFGRVVETFAIVRKDSIE